MSGSGNGHPQERLSEYLDDVLAVEERAAIDRHLASCEECRESLDALRRLSRAIAEESVPPLPADLNEKIGRRLDEATVLRPGRWRFAVPATIAATISAIGILVAVQWREGRLTPPSVQEAARQMRAEEKKAGETVLPELPEPSPPPSRDEGIALKAKERADSDTEGAREKLEAEAQQVGGIASVPETDIEEGTGGAHDNRALASEVARDQPTDDVTTAKQLPQAPPAVTAEAFAAAKVVTPCADRWSDSGARGTWETPDPVATARELNTIAQEAGGIGLWRGIDDGRPYLLIVPRSRYLDVFHVLRARGITGLVDPPALAGGEDCTALSITIVLAR